jgi:hypothetical protein
MKSNKKIKVKEFVDSKVLSSCEELIRFIDEKSINREEIYTIIELESPYKSEVGTGFSRTSILYYYE